jgi:hypothetical protein
MSATVARPVEAPMVPPVKADRPSAAARGQWVEGFEEPIPAGERVIWTGRPDRGNLARHVFHWRKIAVYFAILVVWRMLAGPGDGTARSFWMTFGILAGLGVTAVALSQLLAWLSARSTYFAITDRRVMMHYGIVLSGSVNIPLAIVETAAVKSYADGTSDLALTLSGTDRLAYLQLWPFARPWRVARAEPTLRGLTDGAAAADALRRAVDDK